jgi:hypothetical protein
MNMSTASAPAIIDIMRSRCVAEAEPREGEAGESYVGAAGVPCAGVPGVPYEP